MGYEDLFDDEASDSEPEPGDEADEDSNGRLACACLLQDSD